LRCMLREFASFSNVLCVMGLHVTAICLVIYLMLPQGGGSSESVQCAITGPCLRMRH